jgi:hypothetical protein
VASATLRTIETAGFTWAVVASLVVEEFGLSSMIPMSLTVASPWSLTNPLGLPWPFASRVGLRVSVVVLGTSLSLSELGYWEALWWWPGLGATIYFLE